MGRNDVAGARPVFIPSEEIERLLPLDRAMAAIDAALRDPHGVDPERDDPRLFSEAPGGEFLLMPAQGPRFSGLKALTVAPGNPARGLEKIQGLYLLFSSETLAPIAVLDGAALTAIRTPAVTVSAIRALAAAAPDGEGPSAEPRVLVFGAGTQAATHIRAVAAVFPRARFGVVGRRAARVDALIDALRAHPETAGSPVEDLSDAAARAAATAEAEIIICATTADSPVLDGARVRDGAIVAAVGTHGRARREIDDALVARADLVVEGRGSAERENGNLVSLAPGTWRGAGAPANLRELALGAVTRTPGRPVLYTGVGMAWEDLVCATEVFAALPTAGATDADAAGAVPEAAR